MRTYGLICILVIVLSFFGHAESLSAETWKRRYSSLFGPANEELSDHTLLLWLRELHDTMDLAYVAADSSISNEMKQTVDQWHKFIENTDTASCHVVYLENQHRKLVDANPKADRAPLLFRLGHINLFNLCRATVADATSKINSEIDAATKMRLETMLGTYERYNLGASSEKQMAQTIFKHINVERNQPSNKILALWNEGPCGVFESAIARGFDREKFDRVIEVATYNGLYRFVKRRTDARGVPVSKLESPYEFSLVPRQVEMCKKLGQMMPKLAKHNGRAKTNGLKNFFSSSG